MNGTEKPLAVAVTTTSGRKDDPSTVEKTVNGFASDYTGEDQPLQRNYLEVSKGIGKVADGIGGFEQ